MEENKVLKRRLGPIISIIVIILLICLNIGTIIYFKSNSFIKVKDKYEISLEEFKNFCDKYDIIAYDAKDYNLLIKGAKGGYIHMEDSDYRINYWNMIDENYAWYTYYDEILLIENENKGQISETQYSSGNFSKYTAHTNGLYKTVIKIGNSILWAETDENNKDTLENMLLELGY